MKLVFVCLFVLFCSRWKKIHTVEENKQNTIALQLLEALCVTYIVIQLGMNNV